MKKIAIAALCAAPLLAAPSFAVEDDGAIDFADPSVVFSSLELSYGSEGVSLGYGLATAINDNWSMLSKAEVKEDFDVYRARVAAVNTNVGSGVMFDYIYNTNSKSHTPVINALQVLPLSAKTRLVPVVGAGMISGSEYGEYEQDNVVAITMAQLIMVHNWSDSVWTTLIPQYTYSFNDMRLDNKAGDISKSSLRNFELEAVAGFRFLGTQNVKLQYKLTADNDNQYWAAYTYAF